MIYLNEITPELIHEYYQNFEADPDLFMDKKDFKVFEYDPDKVDAYLQRILTTTDRKDFLIMKGKKPIGEICLKQIDEEKRSCVLSIHLQKDSVKNKGYGTEAEKLLLSYAFNKLNMDVVLASTVLKNRRSQHLLEKLGFELVKQDETFKYYQFKRENWKE